MTGARPKVITRSDPTRISIEWEDGHTSVFPTAELRRLCPCARCVDETTGRRMLDPGRVPDDLVHTDVQLVGHYALAVRFADGHDTGIYPFRMLRELDPPRAEG